MRYKLSSIFLILLNDCIFKDELLIAFHDIKPDAEVHLQVVFFFFFFFHQIISIFSSLKILFKGAKAAHRVNRQRFCCKPGTVYAFGIQIVLTLLIDIFSEENA